MQTDLVPVAVFMLNPAEAQLARALLEAADIPCYLQNEFTERRPAVDGCYGR